MNYDNDKQTPIEVNPFADMSVEQMEYWLKSDERRAVDWRTEDKYTEQWGQMVNEYTSRRGSGEWNPEVLANIRQADILAKWTSAKEAANAKAAEANLKIQARSNWVENGGDPKGFEAAWPDILKDLLVSGRAEAMQAERRNKAARTF